MGNTVSAWRDLWQQYPHATLLSDVRAYADVFDAIEEAKARGRDWEPSPTDFECLGKVTATAADGSQTLEDLIVCRVPVVQVRVPSTVRLCLGLLQYNFWQLAETWNEKNFGAASARSMMLPDPDALLRRRLQPTITEAVDLAAFLITPHPEIGRTSFGEANARVLGLLERTFEPPVPAPLAMPLREAERRVQMAQEEYRRTRRSHGGKVQTKRFEQWGARIERLLGERSR